MKKQLRNIIISLCVVVVLVAGVITAKLLIKPNKTSSSSSSTASISLFKTDSGKITALHIKNSKDEFTIHQSGGKVSVEGIDDSIADTNKITADIQTVADIEASKEIEKGASNLAQYGLDKPTETIDITSDGKTASFIFGNKTPTADGYYASAKGANDVYKVSSGMIDTFNAKKLDFINLTLAAVDSSQLTKLTAMQFGGTANATPITLKQSAPGASSAAAASSDSAPAFEITTPNKYQTDPDKIQTIVKAIENLSADSALSTDMSDANLAKYGLKNPQYKFSFTYNNTTSTMDIGTDYKEGDAEYLPVVFEGRKVIYRVLTSSLSFYNWQLSDYCSRILFTDDIDTVKSVTVSAGSESYTINLSGTGENLVGTYGATKLKTDYVRKFYESVLGNETEGMATKPINASDYAKVVIAYRDNKSPTTFDFIPIDDRKLFYAINGQGDFYVFRTSVDTMLDATRNLVAGKVVNY